MNAIGLSVAIVLASLVSEARADAREVFSPAGVAATSTETLSIVIQAKEGPLWSGTLTIGPQYGNASFSQSKNEYAEPCPDGSETASNRSNTNSSFNLSVSRSNWQQDPNSFNVSFNRTQALRACEGQGSNMSGFSRIVRIEAGGSATIETDTGVKVTLSRP